MHNQADPGNLQRSGKKPDFNQDIPKTEDKIMVINSPSWYLCSCRSANRWQKLFSCKNWVSLEFSFSSCWDWYPKVQVSEKFRLDFSLKSCPSARYVSAYAYVLFFSCKVFAHCSEHISYMCLIFWMFLLLAYKIVCKIYNSVLWGTCLSGANCLNSWSTAYN